MWYISKVIQALKPYLDRGAMDPSAYMDRADWLRVLKDLDLDEVSLRDHRYDCVIHLVTAAKGAESFYSLETNTVRSEGLDMAKAIDDKIMNSWNGFYFHITTSCLLC